MFLKKSFPIEKLVRFNKIDHIWKKCVLTFKRICQTLRKAFGEMGHTCKNQFRLEK